jgi:hypothetical protein
LEAEPPRSYLVQEFFEGLGTFLDKKVPKNRNILKKTTGCDIMYSDLIRKNI